jgi:hypothetical protein
MKPGLLHPGNPTTAHGRRTSLGHRERPSGCGARLSMNRASAVSPSSLPAARSNRAVMAGANLGSGLSVRFPLRRYPIGVLPICAPRSIALSCAVAQRRLIPRRRPRRRPYASKGVTRSSGIPARWAMICSRPSADRCSASGLPLGFVQVGPRDGGGAAALRQRRAIPIRSSRRRSAGRRSRRSSASTRAAAISGSSMCGTSRRPAPHSRPSRAPIRRVSAGLSGPKTRMNTEAYAR